MTKLDPEAIAYKVMHETFPKSTETSPHKFLPTLGGTDLFQLITAAVRADRAQTQPEIYIVQNDTGDVIDVFRDKGEAEAFSEQRDLTIIEETLWESGEYAAYRIQELTAGWEEATGDTASDYYTLSEDDWKFGLNEDDAAEIARLIDWQKETTA